MTKTAPAPTRTFDVRTARLPVFPPSGVRRSTPCESADPGSGRFGSTASSSIAPGSPYGATDCGQLARRQLGQAPTAWSRGFQGVIGASHAAFQVAGPTI